MPDNVPVIIQGKPFTPFGQTRQFRFLVAAIIVLFLLIQVVAYIGVSANIKASRAECQATNDAKGLIDGLIRVAEQNSTRVPPGVTLTPQQQALRDASKQNYEQFRHAISDEIAPIDC